MRMYVALTGTPGTGKSGAAKVLAGLGHRTTTVEALARKHGALDELESGLEVDTERLSDAMPGTEQTVIIEGHLAHHLPNDVCIILRCHPEELRRRLEPRNYTREKLLENLEAEAIDVILVEAVGMGLRVFEIDTTEIRAEAVAAAIESIINGKGDEYSPGKIDWSGAVMDWY